MAPGDDRRVILRDDSLPYMLVDLIACASTGPLTGPTGRKPPQPHQWQADCSSASAKNFQATRAHRGNSGRCSLARTMPAPLGRQEMQASALESKLRLPAQNTIMLPGQHRVTQTGAR